MDKSKSSGGIGIFGLLGVVFVTLKLCGVVHWSWWLVTLPFWGGFAVAIAIFLIVFIFVFVAKVIEAVI